MSALGRLCAGGSLKEGKGRNNLRGNLPARSRLTALAAGVLTALTLSASASASTALAADLPDPLQAGSYETKKIDYEAGKLVVTLADGGTTTQIPLRGSITYAPQNDFSRVIAFVHGRHG